MGHPRALGLFSPRATLPNREGKGQAAGASLLVLAPEFPIATATGFRALAYGLVEQP